MDFTTVKLEIRERLGELSADFFTDAEVERAANEAARRFNAEARWPWLVTEGTGILNNNDETFALPDNIHINRMFNLSVSGASIARPLELERVDPSAGFRLRHHYSTRTGTPRWYYLASAVTDVDVDTQVLYTVKLVPTSDGIYDLDFQYTRNSVLMTGGTDQPDLPEDYHEAVPAWAAGKLFLKEFSISAKANEQFGLYAKVLDQARAEVFVPSTDEVIAWGREHPGEYRVRSRDQWVRDRMPPTLG